MPQPISADHYYFHCWPQPIPYQPYPMLHQHEFHEFYLFTEGQGTQLSECGISEMTVGDLYFFPAGQRHIGNGQPGGPCQGIVLYLSVHLFAPTVEGDADAARILRYLCTRCEPGQFRIPLTGDSTQQVSGVFQAMVREAQQKLPGYRCAMKSFIQEMLLVLLRDPAILPALQTEFRPGAGGERLTEVYHYLHTHFMYPITVEQVAEMAHLSRSQFHAIFKAQTGQTLTAYLNAIRAGAAATLLQQTTTPILQIAYQCGFGCLSHFYAVFKAIYGVTPQAMRQPGDTAH